MAVVNQVSDPISAASDNHDSPQNISNLEMQCQKFINMLIAQTQTQQVPSQSESYNASTHQAATLVIANSHPPSNMAGIPMCLSSHSRPNLNHYVFSSTLVDKLALSSTEWVIDTNATNHMVTTTHLFTSMKLFMMLVLIFQMVNLF